MKEVTTIKGLFVFVEVPDDASDLGMESNCEISYRLLNGEYKRINTNILNFTFNVNGIIGFANNITEEECKNIVEEVITKETRVGIQCFLNYDIEELYCTSAKDSLKSLIISIGLDTYKNYLILKKEIN